MAGLLWVGKGWKSGFPLNSMLHNPMGFFPVVFPTSKTNIMVKIRKSREKLA
jgi:hypothetical protein